MMAIEGPKSDDPYDGRQVDLEMAIEARVMALIADAESAGWRAEEVLTSLWLVAIKLGEARNSDLKTGPDIKRM